MGAAVGRAAAAHAIGDLKREGCDMARFVKRWWKAAGLCAAAALGLAFAARALDHALLDARVDPHDSVSKMCA